MPNHKISEPVDPTNNNLALALLDQHVAGMWRGQEYAYSGVVLEDGHYGLAIAVKDSPGYTPVPLNIFEAETFEQAHRVADGMNRHIGVDDHKAISIIASSMRAQDKRYA